MATGETAQTTEAVTKKPAYLVSKFTSERWREGIYDAEHKLVCPSMNIREDDLLTFDQRVEVETRSLIFQYQLMYADEEYKLLKKEFQSIEERLNRRETAGAEPSEQEFLKPAVPVDKKSRKKPGRSKKQTRSGSETDEKETCADGSVSSDDQKSTKKPGKNPTSSKSGSETDEKESSTEKAKKRSVRQSKKNTSKSGSETDKELTSSQEHERRRSVRKKK